MFIIIACIHFLCSFCRVQHQQPDEEDAQQEDVLGLQPFLVQVLPPFLSRLCRVKQLLLLTYLKARNILIPVNQAHQQRDDGRNTLAQMLQIHFSIWIHSLPSSQYRCCAPVINSPKWSGRVKERTCSTNQPFNPR